MQIPMKNLSDPNFVRSNQESLNANSLVINTNDETKEKYDQS